MINYCGRKISFSINNYPMWSRGGLCIRDNGGRRANHCLDITLTLGKTDVCLTFHPLGRLAVLTRWLPEGARGRGFVLGWLSRGAEN